MKDVSLSTLSLKLKKELNLSYKKVGRMKITRADKCDKNNKISCTKLILGLIEDDYHVVFLDEFLINRKLSVLMIGPERGKLGRINSKPTEFKASFVIAHSQRTIEKVMGTNSSFN